jgi:Tol biopolymer transport system component
VKRVEHRLRALQAPDEAAVALRAWELASVEFERHEPTVRSRRGRALVIAVAVLCIAAIVISPAGAGVVRWVGDRFDQPGLKHAKPFLGSLPAQGRLLVTSSGGLWVVQHDGSKRLLGRYADAAWSPHGLFVAAVRGHELVAMEPGGRVHWTVTASPQPRAPVWSPDGFRIAYLSGNDLRVVIGNGTGDHLFAARVARTAPAWRPGSDHVLAFAARGGVTAANVDLGITLLRARGLKPLQLAWSPNGRALLVVERNRLLVLDSHGHARKELNLPVGFVARHAAFSPDGKTIALLREHSGLSDVRLVSVRGHGWHERAGAPVSGAFSSLEWSPDGRWLLLAWPAADQWLFVSPTRVLPVSGIARAFASGAGPAAFPALGGWCCY